MFSIMLAVVALAAMPATSVFAASAPVVINHHDVAQLWSSQYRELQADRTFFDKIKSDRGEIAKSLTSAHVQQYLNRYGFALRQAGKMIRNTSASAFVKASDQNTNTFEQQLARYLNIMRGLQAKLGGS
jgi:hypothetical protein